MTENRKKHDRAEIEAEQEIKCLLDHGADLEAIDRAAPPSVRHRMRTVVVIAESAFVLGLLVFWLANEGIHHSNSLWVLFFYCFPSQFLLAALPHEPVVLYFGKFYNPLIVALVATAGTALVESINYSVFKYLADMKVMAKVVRSRLVCTFVNLFKKVPFLALSVAGLTPVPFYPFRFLVVLSHYPLPLYILAILVSRLPRFYILAFLGNRLEIPNGIIIAIFAVLVAVAVVPLIREFFKREKKTGVPDPR